MPAPTGDEQHDENSQSGKEISTYLDKNWKTIENRIDQSIGEHRNTHDGFLYNASTLLSLALTGIGAVIATSHPRYAAWISAGAAFSIAAERTLGFGARWRYHVEMKHGYLAVKDMIDFRPFIRESQREAWYLEIWNKLSALRTKEGQIPDGAGAENTSASSEGGQPNK